MRDRRLNHEREADESDVVFMKRALELSHFASASGHGVPFGSVIVRDGKILGEGRGQTSVSLPESAHAEIEAIRDASKRAAAHELKGSTLYVSAAPCPICLSALLDTGIEKVFYCISAEEITSFDPDLKVAYTLEQLSRGQHERAIPQIPILRNEAANTIARYKIAFQK